ncbi:SRPBCC family protein [Pseudonocardia pini]|uniref:SRPBCC family protein n=1 Tax=Pseudonocardia pini TaxID=2758030 RepID=UPI0015F0F102|nr:SRPBCC family protein [Pseudonocardia pini]
MRATIADGRVTASAVVTAPPEEVFALLADPHRHHEFDGSGSVQAAISGPARLGPGDSFGVRMRIGVPYRITNHVVEFEEDRRIAWCHFARAVWRYELEPVPEGTRITETFDYGVSRFPRAIEKLRFPQGNAKSIRDTLLRLQEIFGRPLER